MGRWGGGGVQSVPDRVVNALRVFHDSAQSEHSLLTAQRQTQNISYLTPTYRIDAHNDGDHL